jgi:hypothetical protein
MCKDIMELPRILKNLPHASHHRELCLRGANGAPPIAPAGPSSSACFLTAQTISMSPQQTLWAGLASGRLQPLESLSFVGEWGQMRDDSLCPLSLIF